VASQGQRFRRRALRRGYKVDEVDAFLDRVEATLAGNPVGQPVTAQEVHDVVFRVRFGGYDEWQVDLHLDRVERQIGELEERTAGGAGRFAGPDRMGPPDRLGPPDRMGPPPDRLGAPDRMGPPVAGRPAAPYGPPDRMGPPVGGAPVPNRPMPADDPYARPAPPGYAGASFDGPPPRGYDGPGPAGPPGRAPAGGYPGPDGPDLPGRGPVGGYPGRDDRFDAPDGPGRGPGGGYPGPDDRFDGPDGPGRGPGYPGPDDRFDGPDRPGRRARMDMTAEIRIPDRDMTRGGPLPPDATMPGIGGMGAPAAGMPGPGGGMAGPPLLGPPGSDIARVDQMRRSFQVRRFGSGYDPAQVDRFFEDVLTGMAGRGPIPTTDADFDATQFGLVPGGYFEAEVEAALKDVRDILRRR